MVMWLVGIALAKPAVDLTPVIPTGSVLRIEERFELSGPSDNDVVPVSGRIDVLEGGRFGDASQRWRFFLSSSDQVFDPIEVTYRSDGTLQEPWTAGAPLDNPIAGGLFTDQFRLLPTGKHREGESWTASMVSAFFDGPVQLTWTLDYVTKAEARVSVSGTGRVGRDNFRVAEDYTFVGSMVIDRHTTLPTYSEATWRLTVREDPVQVRATRSLSFGDAVPPAPEVMQRLATAMASASGNRSEAVAAFRNARKLSGPGFAAALPRVLGVDVEAHYWAACFLASASYLEGDAADPLLALTVSEAALALVPTLPQRDERIHFETELRYNAARYAWDAGLPSRASAHKSRFEALYATGEDAAVGSVPAVTRLERERFDAIPVVPIGPVLLGE